MINEQVENQHIKMFQEIDGCKSLPGKKVISTELINIHRSIHIKIAKELLLITPDLYKVKKVGK